MEQFADLIGQSVETVLLWLKAGLPYSAEGDWASGQGFRLKAHWALDWYVMTGVYARASGETEAARALRLID